MAEPSTRASVGGDAECQAHLELIRPVGPVPLGYVRGPAEFWLVAQERSTVWPSEVLRAESITVRCEGEILTGRAELITDPIEKDRVLRLFLLRYGERQFERWYSHPSRIIRVRPIAGEPAGNPVERYRSWLAAEFDNVADTYDQHVTDNRVNRLLRDRSLAELRRAFRSAHFLLEIGCGSGMETLPLLADGHEVLCVDISERMLGVVREKAHAAGHSESLRTFRLSAGQLARLSDVLDDRVFDGAYSTYGAMNCEAEIGAVPAALYRLLTPGAPFVAGVYNRWCLFELVGYGLSGRWRRALARTRSPIRAGNSRFGVDILTYSAREFQTIFDPWFQRERLEAVPAILPPYDLDRYVERFGRRWDALARLDFSLAVRWPLRSLGDHFLLTFSRRQDRTSWVA
jgi:ubiquinone/menaquinone biosynthesis C-methylase UbiE